MTIDPPGTLTALGVAALNLGTQGASELEIQTYAGLTITGPVGTVYSVEYVTDLAQTNTPSAWRPQRRRSCPPVHICGRMSPPLRRPSDSTVSGVPRMSTNTLTDGWSDFRDSEWVNYPARFYRIRPQ